MAYVSLCRKCGIDEDIPLGAVNRINWRIQSLSVTATSEVYYKDINTELEQLNHLRSLELNNIKGDSLPDAVCKMTRLKYIYIRNGTLTFIPKGIGSLSRIETIYFDNQRLSSLPAFIDDIRPGQLWCVSFENNPIVIATWEDQRRVNEVWARVKWFSITPIQQNDFLVVRKLLDANGYGNDIVNEFIGSSFSGRVTAIALPPEMPLRTVPSDLERLDSLVCFSVGRHSLLSVPEWFSYCTALEKLELPNGKLCTLPGFLGNLPRLKFLNVSNNRITQIPSWIGNLEKGPFLNLTADFSCNLLNLNEIRSKKPIYLVEPQLPSGIGEPDEIKLSRDLEIAKKLILSHKPNEYWMNISTSIYSHYIRIKNDRICSIGLSLGGYYNQDELEVLFSELNKLDSLKTIYFETYSVEGAFLSGSLDSALNAVSTHLPQVTGLIFCRGSAPIDSFPQGILNLIPNVKHLGLQYLGFRQIPSVLKKRTDFESVNLFYNPITITGEEERSWMNKFCKIALVEYGNPLLNINYQEGLTWEASLRDAMWR